MTLTIGSLFSGIGGLELGLERAGLGPVLWQCELNPFARRVLEKHWPTVTRFEDVTQPRDYPHVDVICGGFPCQDVSSAGKRRGLGGAKSGLWHHFASVLAKVRPRFVVVENVASGASAWLPTVRRQLCALGYGATAFAVSAADVGAPHERRRIFVVGDTDRDSKPARAIDAEVADVPAASGHVRDGWPAAPEGLRVADGLPTGLHGARLRALGNAVVPQCAEAVGRMIMATQHKGDARRGQQGRIDMNQHDWKFLSSHGTDAPGQSLDSYSQCVWCSALKHDYAHGGGQTSPNYPMVYLLGDRIATDVPCIAPRTAPRQGVERKAGDRG